MILIIFIYVNLFYSMQPVKHQTHQRKQTTTTKRQRKRQTKQPRTTGKANNQPQDNHQGHPTEATHRLNNASPRKL